MTLVGVILGAGYGTRLQRGLKEDPLQLFKEDIGKPKPLLNVGGYTVADHWVEQFYSCSLVGPIVIVSNEYFLPQFKEWMNVLEKRIPDLFKRIHLISDGTQSNATRKGAVHAMLLACNEGRRICEESNQYSEMSGACIVAGDTLLHFKHIFDNEDSFSLDEFLKNWRNGEKHDALIAYNLTDSNETLKRGILEIDDEKRVINFLEKPKPTETSSRLACPPLYGFDSSTIKDFDIFFEEMKDEPLEKKDSPGTFLQWLILRRKNNSSLISNPIIVSNISGRFDIGNIEEYKYAISVFGQTTLSMEAPKPLVSVGKCYARVGFLGNPSDGYNGKTISFTISNFFAEVIIRESDNGSLNFNETSTYNSISSFTSRAKSEKYLGGLRLLKAASVKFFELCRNSSIEISSRGFHMHFSSTIPLQVGLAGSSAIVVATIRALSSFYQIPLLSISKKELWPQHILDVEVQELGIAAGLQDRVVQFYEGLVYMDFNKEHLQEYGFGKYSSLSTSFLQDIPNIYIACLRDKPSSSGTVHSNLRERFENGEEIVLDAMREFGNITDCGRNILESNSISQSLIEDFCNLMDSNFDLRLKILGEAVVRKENIKMVMLARAVGLACKFTGSGGAIICIPRSSCTMSESDLISYFDNHHINFYKVSPF